MWGTVSRESDISRNIRHPVQGEVGVAIFVLLLLLSNASK